MKAREARQVEDARRADELARKGADELEARMEPSPPAKEKAPTPPTITVNPAPADPRPWKSYRRGPEDEKK